MFKIGDVNFDKKNIIIAVIILLVVGITCWGMFSGGIPDNGSGLDTARIELESARTELATTKRELSESRAIITGLQQTNSDLTREIGESRRIIDKIGQANDDIAREIGNSSTINKSSLDLIRGCQSIIKRVRETGKAGD